MKIIKICQLLFLLTVFPCFYLNAAEPITIGGTLGLTGRYAPMSEMVAMGLRLWVEKTNEKGGILGRPLKIIIYDDTSDPEVGKKLYETLITEDKVDLVFGPYSSVITTEIVKVTERYGYSVLASGAASDRMWQQGYNYLFGVYIPASRYAYGYLKFLFKNGIQNIAVVAADDMFSVTVAEGARKWAGRLGLTVTHYEIFKKGSRTLDDLAKRIRDSKAEAIVLGGHFTESVDLRLALKNINWYPRAYFATLGPAVEKYYELLGRDAEGTFTLSNWEAEGVEFPGSREFAEDFLATYGKKPSYQAAAGFASGEILQAAIIKAGSLDRERLREALAGLDIVTIFGRYGVDPTGQQVRHFSLLTQWQQGKLQIVAPENMKSVKALPALWP